MSQSIFCRIAGQNRRRQGTSVVFSLPTRSLPNGRGSDGRARRGFTLIEVLVSIAIIGVLLPPILYGMNLALSASALARDRTQASMLAQQKLAELIAVGPLQSDSGTFDDYPQYQWTSELNDFTTPTVDGVTETMQELDVTVSWKDAGQDRSVKVSTLVYSNAATTAGGILP